MDGVYFTRQNAKDILAELESKETIDSEHVKAFLKRAIACQTSGHDVSLLTPKVISYLSSPSLEVKSLCYMFLSGATDEIGEKSRLDLLQSVRQDLQSDIPTLRVSVLRSIPRTGMIPEMWDLISDFGLSDKDAFVRKCSCLALFKLYHLDKTAAGNRQIFSKLTQLLSDKNSAVACTAASVLGEVVNDGNLSLNISLTDTMVNQLVKTVPVCSEWCQVCTLNFLLLYTPADSEAAESLADNLSVFLLSMKTSVQFAALRLIVQLMKHMKPQAESRFWISLRSPLLKMLGNSHRSKKANMGELHFSNRSMQAEVDQGTHMAGTSEQLYFLILCTVRILSQKNPSIFSDNAECFFVEKSDPVYISIVKLDTLSKVANADNGGFIIDELLSYVFSTEKNSQLVDKVCQVLSYVSSKTETLAAYLVDKVNKLLQDKDPQVLLRLEQLTIILTDTLRSFPKHFDYVLPSLCGVLPLLKTPKARMHCIWAIGEANNEDVGAPVLLAQIVDGFMRESPEVQSTVLTAVVKQFIKHPAAVQGLIPQVLKCSTEQVENPDLRERGLFYWRLLTIENAYARASQVLSSQVSTNSSADRNSEKVDTTTDGDLFQIGMLTSTTGYKDRPCQLSKLDVRPLEKTSQRKIFKELVPLDFRDSLKILDSLLPSSNVDSHVS